MDIFGVLEYKDYRNPKFERFMKFASYWMSIFMKVLAVIGMQLILKNFWVFFVLLVYLQIKGMSEETVFFYSNKNLGPDWKMTFLEVLACSTRSAIAYWGSALIFMKLLQLPIF